MSLQPAGWYDDPRDASQLRYWDGQQWTTRTQERPVAVAHDAAPPPTSDDHPANAHLAAPTVMPAGWWRRVLARLIDGFLIGLICLVPVLLLFPGISMDNLFLWSAVGSAILGFVYETVLVKRYAATLGKLALGLRIRPHNNAGSISWGTSALRSLTWNGPTLFSNLAVIGWAFTLFDLLNGLWPLWDDNNQSLNDKVAKTHVIKLT